MTDARFISKVQFDLSQDIAELRSKTENALKAAETLDEKLKIKNALKKIDEAFVACLT